MIEIRNSETLQRWLLESGHLARLWDRPRFFFDAEEFEAELAGVRQQYPRFTDAEAESRAALRIIGREEGRGRALVPGGTRHWTRRERLFLLALLALAAALAILLLAPRAHAQERSGGAGKAPVQFLEDAAFERYRFYNRTSFAAAQGGQPGGIIIRLANSGTVLATTPAGLLQFNCSTGMSCSWSAGSGSNPPTFTLTSTGGGGSGCIPPGSTANALLFDAGAGACNDVTKFTWNSGTSTLSLLSGGIFDPTAGTVKVPGTNGQLLYNNSGNLSAEDPVVSGPDATGAAQTKNPVAGLAGIDYGVGCGGAACVREAKVDSSGDLYTQTTLTGSWPYSGALGTVGLTGTLPAFASTPAVSLTGSWPYSGALGTVSLTGTLPAFTSIPYVKGYPDTTTASYHASTNVVSAASATDIAVLPGNATNTVLVTRVIVSCTQTTAGIITIQLIKRSVADTSGTSSNMTVVPDDSGYSAGSSVPKIYTANPTTGTAVGNLDTALIGCMASGTATPNDIYIFRPLKPIILRGTAQQLAVNLNGATVTGGSFDVTFEYEETTTP